MVFGFFVGFLGLVQKDETGLCDACASTWFQHRYHLNRCFLDSRSGGVFYDYTLKFWDIDTLLYVVVFNRITFKVFQC